MSTHRHSVPDWEGNPAPEAPDLPGLDEGGRACPSASSATCSCRTLYSRGAMLGRDLAQLLCLPFKVIREPLRFLKDEKCIQVDGGDLVGEVSYKFSLTDLGRKRAQEAMEQCAYVGPAPVPLEDYVEQCYRQTVTGLQCYPEALKAPFGHLVLKEDMFNAIGPAIISGRSVFIYGPPGNGKTAMARAIGDFMNTAGGSIYIPYAFVADGNIITVFDPSLHVIDDTPADYGDEADATVRQLLTTGAVDQRWVRIRRPVIVTGGELNLDMLDLRYNSEANFYQAPIHFKANGGVFLIDDFGRQLVQPQGIAQPLDPAAGRPARLPHRLQRQEVPGPLRAVDHLLDQPRPEGPGGRRLPPPHPTQGRDQRPDPGRVREDLRRATASGWE